MDFRIADTFTDSLARLNGDEQKAVKMTAFDLQMNLKGGGLSFERLNRSKDKNFWSVRVSRDIRIIIHQADDGLMLCYTDHHQAAYAWAERRKIERHPKTGAAQLVEVRETIREIEVPRYVESAPPSNVPSPKAPLFNSVTDDELLAYGVPTDWLGEVRKADEDTILDLTDHLPKEASEALLELATGSKPKAPAIIAATVSPFAHPDAQRRFRVMSNVEELQRALEYPWEKWTVFLHPAQRELVERRYNGSVRVSGSAGTGKTIVALHRAAHLARANPAARVLLTTFSATLARFLRQRLDRLIGNEPNVGNRIDVLPMTEVGRRVFVEFWGEPRTIDEPTLRRMVREAAAAVPDHRSTEAFLLAEWTDVVDAWGLRTWEQYRDVPRLGRKTRLNEKQRRAMWNVFERMLAGLSQDGRLTRAGVFERAAEALKAKPGPYRHAVIDESQDLSVSQVRFLGALAGGRPDGLFFAGDLGQRIFQMPFSWKSLGVDIRGRSHTLRVNYRTSHQIRRQSDRLLPSVVSDVDGVAEERKGTISVFNGPEPEVFVAKDVAAEIARIAEWIRSRLSSGLRPEQIGVFVRSADQLSRAERAVRSADCESVQLDDGGDPCDGKIAVATMHLAKGLEFRAVVVAAVDDGIVPLEERIESVVDEADLEEVYNTERHLLYVACTRARDALLISGVEPVSEFIADMASSRQR
ncbi:MAG: 3'-5' exonuclease [Phycisphaerales bacterium]